MLECSTVKYLKDFIVLADTGNYTRACDQLYLSKSALAKHIKDLENTLEHPLFTQSGHRLVLTAFGRFFLDYAERFVALDTEYEKARTSYESDAASEVRVAVAEHMNCDHMVNMLWDHFIIHYPQYHLSTIEYQAALLSREDLFAMGYELVFGLASVPTAKACGCFTWAHSALIAVLPQSHPLASKSSIRLEELATESFILPPKDTALHQMILSRCQGAGFSPHVNFTIRRSADLADLVADGVGVALAAANDLPAKVYADRVALVALEPSPSIYLNLYYRKDQALSLPAQTFFRYAKQIHQEHEMDIPYYGPEAGVENAFFK
ncbi:MAG: LysR family transcriptional regulator [Lachnospiraceae bacterium]|nr:LysR family transcriptional regulator [Lachnospiraceae bacterium]